MSCVLDRDSEMSSGLMQSSVSKRGIATATTSVVVVASSTAVVTGAVDEGVLVVAS
ncbi:MAG: hypothetical protein GY773_31240 [Actinomycetia bacterium]|nr:hypothetical protein [Actinomycetes bacterium]